MQAFNNKITPRKNAKRYHLIINAYTWGKFLSFRNFAPIVSFTHNLYIFKKTISVSDTCKKTNFLLLKR